MSTYEFLREIPGSLEFLGKYPPPSKHARVYTIQGTQFLQIREPWPFSVHFHGLTHPGNIGKGSREVDHFGCP